MVEATMEQSVVNQCEAFTKCIDAGAQAILRLIRRHDRTYPFVQTKLDELMSIISRFNGYIPLRIEPCGAYETDTGAGTYYVDPSGLDDHHPRLSNTWNADGHSLLARFARTYDLQATKDALHLVYRIQLGVYSQQLLESLTRRLTWGNLFVAADRFQTGLDEIGRAPPYVEMQQLQQAGDTITERYTQVDGHRRAHDIHESVVSLYVSCLGHLRERHRLLMSQGTVPNRSLLEGLCPYTTKDMRYLRTPQCVSLVTDMLSRFSHETDGLRVLLQTTVDFVQLKMEIHTVRSMYSRSLYVERLQYALPALRVIVDQLEDHQNRLEPYQEISDYAQTTYWEIVSAWIYSKSTVCTSELEWVKNNIIILPFN